MVACTVSYKGVRLLGSSQLARMFPLVLLTLLASPSLQQKFDVVWTDQSEAVYLTEDEHKVAFRDVLLEGMARRVFDVYLTACRLGDNVTVDPTLMIQDPIAIERDVKFTNSQSGLYDVDFKAWNLKMRKVLKKLKDSCRKNVVLQRTAQYRDCQLPRGQTRRTSRYPSRGPSGD